MENPFDNPQDPNRYGYPPGAAHPNPHSYSTVPPPPPPPRPQSTSYQPPLSTAPYPVYHNAQYDNPYGGYYDQPPYDNPNSLYTSTGQVVSSEPNPNPFLTPRTPPHPALYYDNNSFNQSSTAVNSERYNSPAPLPGGSPAGRSPGPGEVFSSNSSTTAGGYNGVRFQDEEDADAGDLPLLRPPGEFGGRRTAVDGSSLRDSYVPGGFDPALLEGGGELDESGNIRYGRIPQRVPRRYKTKKRYE